MGGRAPRLLVLGGGGYNPWSVARCWTGVWATLTGQEIPDRLPAEAEALLRELTWSRAAGRNPPAHWFTTLADAGHMGSVRDEVRALIRRPTARLRAGQFVFLTRHGDDVLASWIHPCCTCRR